MRCRIVSVMLCALILFICLMPRPVTAAELLVEAESFDNPGGRNDRTVSLPEERQPRII